VGVLLGPARGAGGALDGLEAWELRADPPVKHETRNLPREDAVKPGVQYVPRPGGV